MERPKVLVAHYSRTGNTRRIARAIAAALNADVEELRDPTDRAGVLGFLRSGLEAWAGWLVALEHPRRAPEDYELVVVGTPVWGMSVSSPVRTYLWHERAKLPRVAFFATMGGTGAERAFEQMKGVAGRGPIATLVVRESVAERGAPPEEIARFARAALASAHHAPRRRKARASA